MQEILPGIYHWTTFHEGIGQTVHSYYFSAADPPVVVDPRVPADGLDVFASRPPAHAFLTNRHHYRHCDRFREAFGLTVWCHRDGLHEFTQGEDVRPFLHGDSLPGGFLALPVGELCPEETALFFPSGQTLNLGDAVIRANGRLGFVPDDYMGEDPPAVRRGLKRTLSKLLERDFDHLLLAHGDPWIGGGAEALRRFLKKLPD